MADDNPDSAILELLDLIKRQSDFIDGLTDTIQQQVEQISALTAENRAARNLLIEYENSHTHWLRPAPGEQRTQRVTGIELEPVNSWVN